MMLRFNQTTMKRMNVVKYISIRQLCEKVDKKKSKRHTKTAEEEEIETNVKIVDTLMELRKVRHKFDAETEAEHAKIGKEYNRQMFIQHNQIVKDFTLKIYLQQDALKALPPDLEKLARIIDNTPPPRNRPYPLWYTPPIDDIEIDDPESAGGKDEVEKVALEKGHFITDKYSTDDEHADITNLSMEEDDDEEKKQKKGGQRGGGKDDDDSDDDYDSNEEAEY